jgi:hypothetical protein
MSNTEDDQLRAEIAALGNHPIAPISGSMMDGVPGVTAWLIADPEKLHDNTRRLSEESWKRVQSIIDQMRKASTVQFVHAPERINKRLEILARLDRRLRRLGHQRWALRVATSLIFFAVVFVAVLVIHSEAAYFSEHLGISELWAFAVLAMVMLPVDVARARLEHYFERRLDARERLDAANDYAELVRIAVGTLIEVAKAYP